MHFVFYNLPFLTNQRNPCRRIDGTRVIVSRTDAPRLEGTTEFFQNNAFIGGQLEEGEMIESPAKSLGLEKDIRFSVWGENGITPIISFFF